MEPTCRRARQRILELARSRPVHLGSSLSVVEILYAVLRTAGIDATTVDSPDRDRLVLSKGHAVWGLYGLLEEVGLKIPTGTLPGHPVESTPVIDGATGALGHGLAIGAGLAVGARLDGSPRRTFVVMGDGELDEGSVWEAALFAGHQRLNSLVAVIDRNGLQQEGPTEEILALEPLREKWEAFGWGVDHVDGHDLDDLMRSLAVCDGDRPRVLIARTVKGKGVSFMEHDPSWHAGMVDDAQFHEAVAELESGRSFA
ncbi:transketolase [Streptomyces sp. NPDC050388]|uniref:transketolase n=1 Tax=Streptomyces sp. NPDC050388 TaxID=3155781 RepID=UPI003436A502